MRTIYVLETVIPNRTGWKNKDPRKRINYDHNFRQPIRTPEVPRMPPPSALCPLPDPEVIVEHSPSLHQHLSDQLGFYPVVERDNRVVEKNTSQY